MEAGDLMCLLVHKVRFFFFPLTYCSGRVGYMIDYHMRIVEEAILGKCEITNTHFLRMTPVSDIDGI